MDVDSHLVIEALRRQNADLAFRVAVLEAQLEQALREEPSDG